MDENPSIPVGTRRDQDIALDMMKFIAMTTGIGRTASPAAGFQGGTVSRGDEYADQLLQLYGRCLAVVQQKK